MNASEFEYLSERIRMLGLRIGSENPKTATVVSDIRVALTYTLQEILASFGTQESFAGWLKTIKEIDAIHKQRLEIAIKEGALVTRELVQKGILDPIDTMHLNLLQDGAKTMGGECFVMAKAGKSENDIVAYIERYISRFVTDTKLKIKKRIREI